MPNPGNTKTYTSGCPKNQNKCWNRTASPPPSLSKNDVLIFRSNNNIVIPAANTGNESTNKNTVVKNAHTKTGKL